MPVYEYYCGECGRDFELLQALREKGNAVCPFCGRTTSKRLVPSSFGIVTKTGFDRNTDKCKDMGKLHAIRMYNKKCVEDRWGDVESGKATYHPGKAPKQYQPRQYLKNKYG